MPIYCSRFLFRTHDQMRAYPVPAMVGSPKNNMPECIQEIADSTLF